MSVRQLRRIGDDLDEIYMRYFAKDEVAGWPRCLRPGPPPRS